jgi:hypothetical protein
MKHMNVDRLLCNSTSTSRGPLAEEERRLTSAVVCSAKRPKPNSSPTCRNESKRSSDDFKRSLKKKAKLVRKKSKGT